MMHDYSRAIHLLRFLLEVLWDQPFLPLPGSQTLQQDQGNLYLHLHLANLCHQLDPKLI